MPERMSEQELRHMKLHEIKDLGLDFLVLRVIGGWIYWNKRLGEPEIAIVAVFVPEPTSPPTTVTNES